MAAKILFQPFPIENYRRPKRKIKKSLTVFRDRTGFMQKISVKEGLPA
jgi:hypothetical protein